MLVVFDLVVRIVIVLIIRMIMIFRIVIMIIVISMDRLIMVVVIMGIVCRRMAVVMFLTCVLHAFHDLFLHGIHIVHHRNDL